MNVQLERAFEGDPDDARALAVLPPDQAVKAGNLHLHSRVRERSA
jgi:hypothetical protein